jgi:hypothetical protein
VVPVVAFAAALVTVAFLAAVLAAAFLVVLVAVLVVEAATLDLDVAFLTTVEVLLSLEWLVLLTLLVFLVAVCFDAGAAAPRRVLVAVVVPDELELVFDVVVVFLDAAARVDLAFSTRLVRMLDAAFDRVGLRAFAGDAGRAISDFGGEATGRSRGRRALNEVGDRTCADSTTDGPAAARPRGLFFGFSISCNSFSLSPNASSL